MTWTPFQDVRRHGHINQPLPPERRKVFCKLRTSVNRSGAVVVGFLRYAAGDKQCPYFVCSGVPGKWEVVAWCDSLPSDYNHGEPAGFP